jgi:hypothetical protein
VKIGMGDGSVRFVKNSIANLTCYQLNVSIDGSIFSADSSRPDYLRKTDDGPGPTQHAEIALIQRDHAITRKHVALYFASLPVSRSRQS